MFFFFLGHETAAVRCCYSIVVEFGLLPKNTTKFLEILFATKSTNLFSKTFVKILQSRILVIQIRENVETSVSLFRCFACMSIQAVTGWSALMAHNILK